MEQILDGDHEVRWADAGAAAASTARTTARTMACLWLVFMVAAPPSPGSNLPADVDPNDHQALR
jgi:hypothetical protein